VTSKYKYMTLLWHYDVVIKTTNKKNNIDNGLINMPIDKKLINGLKT